MPLATKVIFLEKLNKYRWPILAFAVSLFFHLYRLGRFELQGDEASGFLVALKMSMATNDPKMLGHLFLFGHTPLRVLLDFFAIWASHYSEFCLRFPNAFFGALSVFPFFYIAKRFSSEFTAIFFTFSFACLGLAFGNRIAMGVGPYVFFQLTSLYYFLLFLERGESKDLYFFALATFFSIMTYAEGIIFFFPFITILFLHGVNFLEFFKRFYKTLLIFLFFFFPVILLWFFIPYYLHKKGMIDNFSMLGGFRIMARATSGSSNHIKINFNMMKSYVGLIPHLFFLVTFVASMILSLKKSSKDYRYTLIWFLIPALYFHFFVSDPTNHMQFYYCYIVLLGARSFDLLPKKLAAGLVTIVIAFSINHSLNIALEKERVDWGPQVTLGLRPLGHFVRENTLATDLMYLEGVEGYVARIYFGLGYTEDINEAEIIISADKEKIFDEPWKLSAKSCAINIWQKIVPERIIELDCQNLSGMENHWTVREMLRGFLAKK